MPKPNEGVLKANRTVAADEVYTPFYAVTPLLKYISKELVIWCPFDKEWSAYVQTFLAAGNKVIYSHLDDGQDFFEYQPDQHYDVIISNPPYSKKDEVLKRLKEIGKPYAMLLPLATLQGQRRFSSFENTQALIFDKRIGYHTWQDFQNTKEANPAATIYICKDVLPKDLIMEVLDKYDKPLKEKVRDIE